ncbi:MAG: VWA domain-containing protein [Kiritimatiellae bacterium]|nr:VWA domain-containing protein [Kiritimatiellia bacterium]
MSFANPWMFLAFAIWALAAWRLLRRGRNRGIKFSALDRLPASNGGWRARLAGLVPYLLLLGLALSIVAAARPRTPFAHDRKAVDAIAIAMTVDVSGSMNALDMAPAGTTRFTRDMTRLAVVKKLFAQFVEKRPDDLIGLVTFGGFAATRCPLTADHAALLKVLEGVQVPSALNEERATAIGDGLATAILRLKEAKPVSKVAILLSDGENSEGLGSVDPQAAAESAAKLGVKVYTIGVGTGTDLVPAIVPNVLFGGENIDMKRFGFNEEQLKSIAATTGGRYFAVNDRNALGEALDEIDQLETTELDADVYERWHEHFRLFLLPGALLTALAVTLSMIATRRLM